MPSYPKWLYHHSKPAALVVDEAEHKALGAGWVESPADAQPETVATVVTGESLAAIAAPKKQAKSK